MERQNPQNEKFFFFFLGVVFWLGFPYVSQNIREFYESHFIE